MKRAPALQDLSRDHLKALLVAKRLREARDPELAAEQFLGFWEAEQHHFRIEEEVLLPRWAAGGELDRMAVVRMLEDHLAIRCAALRLRDGALSLPELRELGTRLHDHVRFEERELFPLIEHALEPKSMSLLAAELADAHAT